MNRVCSTFVAFVVAVGLAACDGQPATVPPGRAEIPEVRPLPSVVAPATSGTAVAAVPVDGESAAALECQGGSGVERGQVADLIGARSEQSADGSLMMVLSSRQGDQVVGCMSADTATASLERSLSVGSVLPLADGIAVVIASPSGAALVDLPWLRAAGFAPESGLGFTTRLFVVDPSVDLARIEGPPTVVQITSAVLQARSGTATTMGLGPDLLVGR